MGGRPPAPMKFGVVAAPLQYGVLQQVVTRSVAGFEVVPLGRKVFRAATLRPQATRRELWLQWLSYPSSRIVSCSDLCGVRRLDASIAMPFCPHSLRRCVCREIPMRREARRSQNWHSSAFSEQKGLYIGHRASRIRICATSEPH